MPFSVNADVPLKLQVFFGATAVFVFIISTITVQAIAKLFSREDINSEIKGEFPQAPAPPLKTRHDSQDEELQLYKDLYFKLQHLEQYPEILPQSRDLLISLFSETLSEALKKTNSGILSVEQYTPESLADFMRNEADKTAQQWEQYLARRKAGGRTEIFSDREEAKWWLRQIAPVRYVDGAWLGHINTITTPFSLRRTAKDAFQVLSEELGDGDLGKNHVYVYQQVMNDIAPELPPGDSADFGHPRHQMGQLCIWKAAVAQLLISLFPHDFLPEILGFNMHFEVVSIETLVAAKELKEVKINPYYFLLHISIDNADSGHTAMAIETVRGYLEHIRKSAGDLAAQQAWKRVQAGYTLSASLITTPDCATLRAAAVGSFPRNEHEAEVAKIFKAKAHVAHRIHCSSAVKIGRRTLVDWLEPNAFASPQWQMDFLHDLSNLKPWVYKGDSRRSKLIQELCWEGKMFGSFTQREVESVQRWIDSLGKPYSSHIYWSFTGRPEETASTTALQNQDITANHPVFSPNPANEFSAPPPPYLPPNTPTSALTAGTPVLAKLLPIWFAHPCLLESFVCIPAKTSTPSAAAILCMLRAQSGFGAESPGVAGMDEVRREDSTGIVELGLEMVRRRGLAEPACLKDVLGMWRSEFAVVMLRLAMRPEENRGLLLGMAAAFVVLYDVVAASALLSESGREVLGMIAERGRRYVEVWVAEMREDEVLYAQYCRGYGWGRAEIESCFEHEGARDGA
ncbi:hypothetical protein P167DRAFT_580332 [Morchella conica CCBAS932]|uniref:Heme oxygenase-like protein n=1 Tax=Morchella conica CCBAS932 TaxID=1392247 RepID=A0A3N4KLB0_9PEZI|nr:hypothetical protein P167DRAFT_580332 [Morchella conica CCBAS932]